MLLMPLKLERMQLLAVIRSCETHTLDISPALAPCVLPRTTQSVVDELPSNLDSVPRNLRDQLTIHESAHPEAFMRRWGRKLHCL